MLGAVLAVKAGMLLEATGTGLKASSDWFPSRPLATAAIKLRSSSDSTLSCRDLSLPDVFALTLREKSPLKSTPMASAPRCPKREQLWPPSQSENLFRCPPQWQAARLVGRILA